MHSKRVAISNLVSKNRLIDYFQEIDKFFDAETLVRLLINSQIAKPKKSFGPSSFLQEGRRNGYTWKETDYKPMSATVEIP